MKKNLQNKNEVKRGVVGKSAAPLVVWKYGTMDDIK